MILYIIIWSLYHYFIIIYIEPHMKSIQTWPNYKPYSWRTEYILIWFLVRSWKKSGSKNVVIKNLPLHSSILRFELIANNLSVIFLGLNVTLIRSFVVSRFPDCKSYMRKLTLGTISRRTNTFLYVTDDLLSTSICSLSLPRSLVFRRMGAVRLLSKLICTWRIFKSSLVSETKYE